MTRTLGLGLTLLFLVASAAPAGDWPQWGGTPYRNMVSEEKGLPIGFEPGPAARDTSMTEPISGGNVRWVVKLGGETHGSPTVAGGRVFIGTSNPYKRDGAIIPRKGDGGGRLLCLDFRTGKLLWELATPKLPEARAPHSDNGYGVCSSTAVEGNRVYLVNDRTDVLCLDVEGLANGNEGPYLDEAEYLAGLNDTKQQPRPKVELRPTDADIVWHYNIFEQLDAHPHDATACSPLIYGDLLYVCTGNGHQRHGEPRCSIRRRRA